MTDIHMHILPGLDDGAEDIYEALEMADTAARDGVRNIVATPHFNVPGEEGYTKEEYTHAFRRLQRAIDDEHIPVSLFDGAENFAAENISSLISSGRAKTLAGSRYILIEFDFGCEAEFANRIAGEILSLGLVPVIAHAERYEFVRDDVFGALRALREAGCVIQLNRGSLEGSFGADVMEAAHFIVSNRLCDVVASDAHGAHFRTPQLSRAADTVANETSERYARLLFGINPQRIIADKSIIRP